MTTAYDSVGKRWNSQTRRNRPEEGVTERNRAVEVTSMFGWKYHHAIGRLHLRYIGRQNARLMSRAVNGICISGSCERVARQCQLSTQNSIFTSHIVAFRFFDLNLLALFTVMQMPHYKGYTKECRLHSPYL
jgi:hypothetical protein